MEENKVLLSLDKYNDLHSAATTLEILKGVIFNNNNHLKTDKKGIYFVIDEDAVKAVLPCEYHLHFLGLQKKEEQKNV